MPPFPASLSLLSVSSFLSVSSSTCLFSRCLSVYVFVSSFLPFSVTSYQFLYRCLLPSLSVLCQSGCVCLTVHLSVFLSAILYDQTCSMKCFSANQSRHRRCLALASSCRPNCPQKQQLAPIPGNGKEVWLEHHVIKVCPQLRVVKADKVPKDGQELMQGLNAEPVRLAKQADSRTLSVHFATLVLTRCHFSVTLPVAA